MSMQIAKGDDLVPMVVNPNNDADFADVASTGKYLPRVQLFGGNSNEAKRGKIGIAHWGLVLSKDNIVDLGKEFDFLPVAWRPKAMELGEEIISCFKPKSPQFQDISARSEIPDSGCMYGPEFLIWLPVQGKFAGLYLSNKTARKAATPLRDIMGRPATAKSRFIETKKYSWHGPEFTICSTPFDLPDPESAVEEQEKFLHPPDSEVEKVVEPETGRKR